MSAVVYWLLDANDNILYIGCTSYLRLRMTQHAYTKGAWWHDGASVAITDRMPRMEALQAERHDIIAMSPRYNIRTDTPELDRSIDLGGGNRVLQRYLTAQGWVSHLALVADGSAKVNASAAREHGRFSALATYLVGGRTTEQALAMWQAANPGKDLP